MNYTVKANSVSKQKADINANSIEIPFGITPETKATLPSPADLYLSSFAACVLKNVERFSSFMKFEYTSAEITVDAERLEKPPRMDNIKYELKIFSEDSINVTLLKRNIEKFGTIYNTVKLSSKISGQITHLSANK